MKYCTQMSVYLDRCEVLAEMTDWLLQGEATETNPLRMDWFTLEYVAGWCRSSMPCEIHNLFTNA